MKFLSLLACLTATTVLASPHKLKTLEDGSVGELPFKFLMKAYDAHDTDARGASLTVGVRAYNMMAPLILEEEPKTVWTLKDGVLSPEEAPNLKVDLSLVRVYPPMVALMPREMNQVPGYRVEATDKSGQMVIAVAEPLSGMNFSRNL